jgi:signal transduction histidine kinase
MIFTSPWEAGALASRWRGLRGRWWVIVGVEAVILAVAAVDAVPTWSSPPASDWDWTVSAVAVAGLLLRRRWSLVSWLLCLPTIIWGTALIAPLVAVFTVADHARRRLAVVIVVALTFAAGVIGDQLDGVAGGGNIAVLQGLVYAALVALGPAALGLLLGARRQLTAQLRQLTEAQHSERVLLAGSVLAEERSRLAREMHDVVSHQVSLIALQAGALRVTATAPETRDIAATIRDLATRTLDELRVMIGVLRSGQANELAPPPRLADIPRLIDDSGLPARLDSDLTPGLEWPDAVQRAAYRTVQEGLTNARKHAPGAPVTVCLRSHGGSLAIHVHNDSPPHAPAAVATGSSRDSLPSGGHGLIGLRERAELLGGHLQASQADTGGFDLLVTLGQKRPPALRLARHATEEGRRGQRPLRHHAVAGPVPDRDDPGRHQAKAVEEALDFLLRVNTDLRRCVGRGEVLSLGGIAGTAGDDQVTAGGDCRPEATGDAAGGPRVGEVQDAGQDHAHGLGQVDQAREPVIGEDALGVVHVTGYRDHVGTLGEQPAGV